MNGIRPVLHLLGERLVAPLLRLKSRHLDPLAPADMHLSIAIRLANVERAR
jgi:hypothetical protein